MKKKQRQDKATAEEGNSKEGQKTTSKACIAGLRSAYESMGIKLPPTGDACKPTEKQSEGCSVYELFGIPMPNFLGGNQQGSQIIENMDATKSKTKAEWKNEKLG